MGLVTELVNKKTIVVYKPQNCSKYEKMSKYALDKEIDDYHIDRHNRLYPIIDHTIYALRVDCELLATEFIEYKVIETDYGCLFFWTQFSKDVHAEDKENKCVLMCREVENDLLPEKELMHFEHENYKLLVISRNNYILYFENIVHITYKEKYRRTTHSFKIIDACYLTDKLIFLDANYNVQVYSLLEMRLSTGFKSIGITSSIISSRFANIVALMTDEGVFCIDIQNRSIIKKKMYAEMNFTFDKIIFMDRRTMLFIGDGVVEYCLPVNELFSVIERKKEGRFKYFHDSQGYVLNGEFPKEINCQCKCYNLLLGFKIEVRREIYQLNKRITELENELKSKEKD